MFRSHLYRCRSCSLELLKRGITSFSKSRQRVLPDGPKLKDFLVQAPKSSYVAESDPIPYLDTQALQGWNRKVFFDVYGCQMNVNDTEIVWSILQSAGFSQTRRFQDADVILLMTCSIRDNAEKKIWNRLNDFKKLKKKRSTKVGILGCMAERLKHKLIEQDQLIDLVAGPDSYKDLPRLLAVTDSNEAAINVMLSQDETYADILPVRLNQNSISAFVTIMRGCNNMCTYCIVPFTRGRERSRPVESILKEVKHLSDQGVKEVTLLGQNVNSYRYLGGNDDMGSTNLAKGFKTVYKPLKGGLRFAQLLDQVASVDPQMRIRFTSPHPKDFPDEVLDVISSRRNVCANIHLPAQSGNSQVLERMRRGYSREAYLELVDHIRAKIPSVTLSSDFICGFCGETEDEFQDTEKLIETVGYHVAYLFAYSMREKTAAHRRYQDDVPDQIKQERLIRMVVAFRKGAEALNKKYIGQRQTVLIEGESKRSVDFLAGRNDGNIKVIVPSIAIPLEENSSTLKPIQPGDYISVAIEEANSQVLKGKPLHHTLL